MPVWLMLLVAVFAVWLLITVQRDRRMRQDTAVPLTDENPGSPRVNPDDGDAD